MANHVIHVPTAHVNISPVLFHEYATQYQASEQAFYPSATYSPVPYFLICRAIELQLKSKHLESKSRAEVKKQFGHNLKASYDALPTTEKILDAAQYVVLCEANAIYDVPNKGFEYVSVGDAVGGLKSFPSLTVLEQITAKLISH